MRKQMIGWLKGGILYQNGVKSERTYVETISNKLLDVGQQYETANAVMSMKKKSYFREKASCL